MGIYSSINNEHTQRLEAELSKFGIKALEIRWYPFEGEVGAVLAVGKKVVTNYHNSFNTYSFNGVKEWTLSKGLQKWGMIPQDEEE